MRRALGIAIAVVAAAAGVFVLVGAGGGDSGTHTYRIELDNAFGLTGGADLKVGGVRAGKITGFGLTKDNHALVDVKLTQPGFETFRSDVQCVTRPQSLIGEYFIDCQPGRHGKVLKNNAIVPVSHTSSTIPADLVADIMRLPYRQRFRIIIGELGAAVAGRGQDLNAAIRRAVPALRETDSLLAQLADQRATLQSLTSEAHKVVGTLDTNRKGLQDFIVEARKAAQVSAERRTDLAATFHRLPGFLRELRPTMADLGRVADTQGPALRDLEASAGQLSRFLVDVRPFSNASIPALDSLARMARTGRPALNAARPVIALLRQFTRHTPELSQNLSIVLRDLDDRSRAVEPDSRAAVQLGHPASFKYGYTGLEALLMYAFNQTLAINAFDKNGHVLRVDPFIDAQCSPYAARQRYPKCRAWLGPNQPGINRPDPSDMSLINSGAVKLVSGESASAASSSTSSTSSRSASSASRAAAGRVSAPARRARRAAAAAPAAGGNTSAGADGALDALNYLLGP